MNPDGTGQTRLTNNSTTDDFPSWSPDGTKIAFVSSRNGGVGIFVMNADGTNPVQLRGGWVANLAWSPDGTKMAFSDSGYIWVMNADGTNQSPVLYNGCFNPRLGSWSPDGTKIVLWSDPDYCAGNWEIYTMNSDGTNLINISNNPANEYTPFWSPLGSSNYSQIELPKTGQTKCYDSSGAEINCAGTGQDGEFQVGVDWPNPRFTVSGDCVTDNLTGLMWAKNGNLPNGTWQEALDYVASMNAGSGLCGYKDWRLPNVNELESLLNSEVADPATWLNSQGFSNVQSSDYWSSTSDVGTPGYAWIVLMGDGRVYGDTKSFPLHVWPLRSGQSNSPDASYPANIWKTGQTETYATGDDGDLEKGVAWPSPRFTDHNNGTVTDNLTGLMWTKDANLAGGTKTWQEALDYVKTLNTGGCTDWRLPNRKELFSLIDHSTGNLPTGHPFQNVVAYHYYSSTTVANVTYLAWIVNMSLGYVTWIVDKSGSFYVWPVRSGQGVVTLSGRMTDSQTGQLLKDALVNIHNSNFNKSGYTDNNGDYRIETIPTGVYTLTASKPGTNYGQYQESFNIAANTTKNIFLSPFIYQITISTIYNGTSQTLQIQASAYNLTNGTTVTSGAATYAVYEGGTQLRSGSLTYSTGSGRWVSGSINFPFSGTFTAYLTINGNSKNTDFTTSSNLITIKGKVKNTSDNIISGANVQLYSALDQSTPVQSVTSTSSGYSFSPVTSGYYLISAVKDSANGKTETFYTGSNTVEKDITIEANELVAKYSGHIDQLWNSLTSLIDREPELLNEMSRWIDFELNNFTLWDIADKIWSLVNTVKGVTEIPEKTKDITKLVMDTQYFTDKTKAIGTLRGIIKLLATAYGTYNFSEGLYSDFDRYFNHPDENGISYGKDNEIMVWAGEGNHYLPLDYLKSNSTPYSSSVTNLNSYKSGLKNYLSSASPDSHLDLDKVTQYLQERNDLLKESLSNDDNRSQTMFYLPETKNYFTSTLKPIYIRYMKDVDKLGYSKAIKFITNGVSTASWLFMGPAGGLAVSVGTTAIDPIISYVEERVEGDLLNQWKFSRKEYERDLIDYPNYLNSIYGFLQSEFSTSYYLRTGNTFSGQISNVNIEFSSIPILGGIISIPDTSQINVSSTITNTGNQSRLSLFSENYAYPLFSTIFRCITNIISLLWDREPPKIGLLSDLKYSIYEDVPTNISYNQTHTLLTNTNFLSLLFERQLVHLNLYSGPWKVDEQIPTYSLLYQTSSAHPELRQNLLGGVRTLQKVLTLQDATDIVTREKERHSITVDSGTPIYEQDVTVSSDVSKLHVYLYCGVGDADLHLYDGSSHVGFNYDKSANDIEFPATYTGPQSNPEIITVPDAAGKTLHLKINMTQPSGQGNVTGTLIIMEEPLRPAVMATSPLNIEIDAFPGQKGLALSIRVAESSQQSPLNNLNATISSLTNAYGQSLTLTSPSSYSNSVLSGGSEETITFTFDVPNDATKIYTGTITISSGNAGEIIKNVTIRVDSDEDGLPDYWEKLYNFNPDLSGEADLDSDGDGFTNLEEYYGKTDPLDSSDYPSTFISIYVSKDAVCGGKTVCFDTIQKAISAVTVPTIINITQETYNDNLILDVAQTIELKGGWNSDFSVNSGHTTINGSLTISNGELIIKNINVQ